MLESYRSNERRQGHFVVVTLWLQLLASLRHGFLIHGVGGGVPTYLTSGEMVVELMAGMELSPAQANGGFIQQCWPGVENS